MVLTSVNIGNSVTEIGDYAFCDCIGLTSVNIGNSVTKIGENAFYGCTGLTSINIGNSFTWIGDGPSRAARVSPKNEKAINKGKLVN